MGEVKQDRVWMEQALLQAEAAFTQGEVPVGAVLVLQGEMIGVGHNRVEDGCSALKHAEMEALDQGGKFFSDFRLVGTTLYTTLEPCAMCMGAILLSRVDRLVYAAPDLRHGALGSWIDLLAQKHPTHCLSEVVSGVLQEKSANLMRSFFQQRRRGSSGISSVRTYF